MDEIHKIPTNDLREHESNKDCWCEPLETEVGLWVHNSLDQREKYETGELKLN